MMDVQCHDEYEQRHGLGELAEDSREETAEAGEEDLFSQNVTGQVLLSGESSYGVFMDI